ncbi:MAG: hypothetical protein WA622_12285 [Mycobacterium sp.]|uniref:DUF7065 domain-containing protein n=3 Tax=Mycobacterium sp. TaxID=1785 RepID=UPI003BB63F87
MSLVQARPGAWLTDADELSHESNGAALWSENWLTYAWCPNVLVGIYFHICRRPGPIGVYEETFNVYLPGDRFLTTRGFAPLVSGAPSVAGVLFRCDEPFRRWTKRFRGAARLVTGDELRAGPLVDGPYIDVDLELEIRAMSPPFDIGSQHLTQAWGTGHYEQHHEVSGVLRFGDERIELAGAGLRDHSWGPRDWEGIGDTTWFHGQFPESGRSFMGISVPGRPPFEPYTYACISDRESVHEVEFVSVPHVTAPYTPDTPYEFSFAGADGVSVIRAELVQSMPMSFMRPAEIGIGFHRGAPTTTHDFRENMTRFEWDGEVGYGLVTGARDVIDTEEGAHGA